MASEDDGSIDVCAVLMGELNREVSLELAVAFITADIRDFTLISLGSALGSGASDGLDQEKLYNKTISDTRLIYTFASGSEPGSTVCNSIGISVDGVVENTEQFTVFLQGNPEDNAINITNGDAVVFINDSSLDCMFGF